MGPACKRAPWQMLQRRGPGHVAIRSRQDALAAASLHTQFSVSRLAWVTFTSSAETCDNFLSLDT